MFDIKKFKKRTFNFILIFSILFSSLFFSKTLAKYVSNQNQNTAVGIARPVFVYDGLNNNQTMSMTLALEEINPDTGVQTYFFDITNSSNDFISEVNLNYNVTIETTNNLPLNLNITCNEATPVNQTITSTMNGTSASAIFSGSFLHSISSTHTYMLEVQWQEGETDWKYSNEFDEISIIVNWEQV